MPEGQPACDYCGAAVTPVSDLIERVVERVLSLGGRAEMVRGAAAAALRKAGGIGAFMRF